MRLSLVLLLSLILPCLPPADAQACGEEAPTPLSERSYSGMFVVRTSSQLHGRLALEAAEQRVSMNQWVVQKLSGRDLGSGFGSFGFD